MGKPTLDEQHCGSPHIWMVITRLYRTDKK